MFGLIGLQFSHSIETLSNWDKREDLEGFEGMQDQKGKNINLSQRSIYIYI